MFNFVCKTLLLHYGRRCSIIRTSYNKDFAFPLFMKCLSTATSNQHSFTVSYLINSCGFSPQYALSASKYVHFESPENADSVFAFFRNQGFSETQILKIVRVYPKVLCSKPEDTLLPKLQFFYSKGFSSQELVKLIYGRPHLLLRSLENHLIPTLNYLDNLFQSSGMTVAAIKCSPFLLRNDVQTCIAPTVDVLRGIGVPDRNIILFLRMWSRFVMSSDTIKETVEAVKEMGFDVASSQFIIAVSAKQLGRTIWESKVDIYLRRWGWSEEEFAAAFRKCPMCMIASKEKIMAVMDFFVNKMGLESSVIAKRPDVISLSVEKRFIPRAAVFHFLLSKGLIKSENTNLFTLFKCPEKTFMRKFVYSYDEAPGLLKLYQEKLSLSKMT